MTEQDKNERTEAASIANDNEIIENKKNITLKDFKDEILGDRKNSEILENEKDSDKKAHNLLFGRIALWAFSVLLFISGVFLAVFTVYTGIGLVIGIAMIVAAVCLPFAARGDWIKRYVK